MTGMNAATGRSMDEDEHIRQSVRDILTTPVGSRIMRRDYGSLVPDLIDQPGNPANRLRLMAATIMAILRWEPRITISNATIEVSGDGSVSVAMESYRRAGPRSGSPLNLSVPIR